MPTILGVDFGREFLGGTWSPGEISPKIHWSILLKKFVDKFAGNFPKIRQAQIINATQIRSVWPWDQQTGSKIRADGKWQVHTTMSTVLDYDRPRPTQGLPGPSGTPEESEKSPERVPRGRAPKVPNPEDPKLTN